MKKILIIEDDLLLNKGIVDTIVSHEISVETSYSINEAKEKLEQLFDLIILDLNLPDGSGLDLMRELRENGYSTPIIILTANDKESDEIKGLEMGANDYITKPFSLNVLKARVANQLRNEANADKYISENLNFHFDKNSFFKGNEEIKLNKTEIKLIKYLILNKGITLTRDNILDYIWTDSGEYVYENTLSVCIKRLRDKVEDNPKEPRYIKTVYGLGYYWEDKK